jgi:hypothetical protein
MEFGLARMTAAPVKGTLNGKPVELCPLTLGDWGKIEQHMRQQIMSAAASACIGIPPDRARIVMREAHKEAASTSIASEDAKAGLFASMGTMLIIVQLSMSKHNPAMSLAVVEEMIGSDFEALAKMAEVIFDISFPGMDKTDLKNPLPGQEVKQ